jgi:hypothetical protein
MIAKAPAALAESTAKAEHLVENLQPLADVSFESRAAAEDCLRLVEGVGNPRATAVKGIACEATPATPLTELYGCRTRFAAPRRIRCRLGRSPG